MSEQKRDAICRAIDRTREDAAEALADVLSNAQEWNAQNRYRDPIEVDCDLGPLVEQILEDRKVLP